MMITEILQKTITEPVEFEGIGIHSGEWNRIILYPAHENEGISFYIKGYKIPLSPEYVVNTFHSTDLGIGGTVIRTVEHLRAVFHLLGITNLVVEVLEGCEIPIIDGSGYYFYKKLKEKILIQGEEAEAYTVEEEITVRRDRSLVKALPAQELEVTYEGEFKYYNGKCRHTFRGNLKDIILARTFCFDHEIEMIKRKGLGKGGSLKNTLVLGKNGVYNQGGLRYREEPIRHKILDFIGDLYLLGKPVRGKFFSFKGGHSTNFELVKILHKKLVSV